MAAFNAAHRWTKRGLALVPTKFGIAFTATFMNQSAALVHVHPDGSVLLAHGGTEMGQGLHTKMAQVSRVGFYCLPRVVAATVFASADHLLTLRKGLRTSPADPALAGTHQRDKHHHGGQRAAHGRLGIIGPQWHGRAARLPPGAHPLQKGVLCFCGRNMWQLCSLY